MNVLIINGHPDLQNSIANAAIIEEYKKQLPEAQIRNIGELYPDFNIDVKAEQEALLWADLIVWQFPYWWYSLPALMKHWQDVVFAHGFSHGRTAVLGGKKLLVSFTTGAPAIAYDPTQDIAVGDINNMVEIFSGTAKLCRLDYQGAMWLNGVSYQNRADEAAVEAQRQQAREYAQKVIDKIKEIEG